MNFWTVFWEIIGLFYVTTAVFFLIQNIKEAGNKNDPSYKMMEDAVDDLSKVMNPKRAKVLLFLLTSIFLVAACIAWPAVIVWNIIHYEDDDNVGKQ